MDLKELKEILKILDANEITEFELEEEGRKLKIRKGSGGAGTSGIAPAVVALAPAMPPAAPPSPAAPTTTAASASAEADAGAGLTVVKSPIVGTFYRAPDPNSTPFVNTGDRVRVGQVLCIIEAMKLMNEIESEVAGEIVRVHHESGQPVQYGEPLFTIRP
jgi:acetyl-CoA carboxylase biotin carboxyl carrier protein